MKDNDIEYIYNKKSLKEQFAMFCKRNNPANYEVAVEFFSVFGGLNRDIDCSKSLESQIEIHILKRYRYIRNDISAITKGDDEAHKILSGIALGDRRTNSAFKRCKISFDNGIDIIDDQCGLGMLKLEKTLSRLSGLEKDMSVSEKLIFTTPFTHFWFSFVSPIFKGIRDGEFTESLKNFSNKKAELTSFVFEQLCHEVVKEVYKSDEVKTLGRYWDNSGDIINLLGKTKSGKILAGSIKYTNSKVKTSSLTELKDNCKNLQIIPHTYIMFSKKGFSNELKNSKSDTLKLFTLKHLKLLHEL